MADALPKLLLLIFRQMLPAIGSLCRTRGCATTWLIVAVTVGLPLAASRVATATRWGRTSAPTTSTATAGGLARHRVRKDAGQNSAMAENELRTYAVVPLLRAHDGLVPLL